MSELARTTDGVVTIRPPRGCDAQILVTGRDEVFHRFLGPGDDEPRPLGCIVVDDQVVGWVDYDTDRAWLESGAVNVGYHVFAAHRGHGYASRAVQLLMHHLALRAEHHTATLLIHPDNEQSLAVAARTRFTPHGDLDGNPYFRRPIPPLTYTDGVVSIRGEDSTEHRGPTWTFAVEATLGDDGCHTVGRVDCDLAHPDVPRGEANITYSTDAAHRDRGYATHAVRLLTQFLRDHTGTRRVHLIADADNGASRRVAVAVGARADERWIDDRRRMMIRHVLTV